jgi:hypothetical protein
MRTMRKVSNEVGVMKGYSLPLCTVLFMYLSRVRGLQTTFNENILLDYICDLGRMQFCFEAGACVPRVFAGFIGYIPL